ncbi:MAG: RNA-binding protein [Beijerinckiaceae bacterium]
MRRTPLHQHDAGQGDLRPDGETDLERSCIVSRTARDPGELIRFVRGPDGAATPDLKRKLPGRGCWVTAEAAVLSRATSKMFSRAFRAETAVAPDLAELVGRLLRQEALQALSLANKAGCVVTGFDKSLSAIADGRAIAVLHAQEAAENGRRKLIQPARRSIAVLSPFTGAEMDLALGRIHVIHAALTVGAVSTACLNRCRLLLSYGEESGDAARADEVRDNDDRAEPQAPAGSQAE